MRANNISQHISSKADSVILNPATAPAFGTTIVNLQLMANAIDAHATKPLPVNSEGVAGIGELATLAEVLTGTDKVRLVTPFTLHEKMARPNATEFVYGLVRFGTAAEREETAANFGIAANTVSVWDIVRNKATSSESKRGSMMISTLAAAKAGVDNTTAMTPAKVKAAIDTFAITSLVEIASATETVTGTVKISPSPITNVALHNGYAVSPKGFILTRALQNRVGTVRMATQAESNARTLTDVAIAPATLPIASDTQYGITALLHGAAANVTNKALSAHGATSLINRYGDTMSGDLNVHNVYSVVAQSSRGDSLTRKDYVDGQVSSKAPTVHSHGAINEAYTNLFVGPLNLGNFTLNQPWWNFDSIIIDGSRDGGEYFFTREITRQQIERAQSLYPNWNLIANENYFWYGKFAADGRTFVIYQENCYIWRVTGVTKTIS